MPQFTHLQTAGRGTKGKGVDPLETLTPTLKTASGTYQPSKFLRSSSDVQVTAVVGSRLDWWVSLCG
jgi:hypothetical protein